MNYGDRCGESDAEFEKRKHNAKMAMALIHRIRNLKKAKRIRCSDPLPATPQHGIVRISSNAYVWR